MDEHVAQEIQEDRANKAINVELSLMVDQGLLEMGVTSTGEARFWPTPRGALVLGMEMDETPETVVSA